MSLEVIFLISKLNNLHKKKSHDLDLLFILKNLGAEWFTENDCLTCCDCFDALQRQHESQMFYSLLWNMYKRLRWCDFCRHLYKTSVFLDVWRTWYVGRDISVSPQCFIYNRMLTAEPKMMLLKRFSLGLQNMKCPLQPSIVKMAGRRWVSMLPGWKLTGRLTESSTSTFPLWRILFHSRPRVCCHYPAAYKPKCCLSCLSSIVLPAVVPFSAPVLWNVSRSI